MLSLYVFIPIGQQLGDFFAFGTQPNSLGELVTRAIDVIITFAVILTLLYLLVGGINWITSEGKPDKLEKARNHVINALIGIALTVGAFAIWNLVVKQFLGINITEGVSIGGGAGTSTPRGVDEEPDCGKNPYRYNPIGQHYERRFNKFCEPFTGDPNESKYHGLWYDQTQ